MIYGYSGFCQLKLEDDNTLIYSYGCFNLSQPGCENKDREYDGLILIDKSCFVEPIITEKIKRQPGKRKKLIVKRHPIDVDCAKYLNEGLIVVENSKYTYETYNGIDRHALRLLNKLMYAYQMKGEYPEWEGFIC